MHLLFRRERAGDAASAFLSRQARGARDVVGPFSVSAIEALQAEAATLPDECDLFTEALLQVHSVATDVREVRRAMMRGSGALEVRRADTPEARVAVAMTLVALREAGAIDEHLAAAAVLELVNGRSPITEVALIRAAARAETAPVAAASA